MKSLRFKISCVSHMDFIMTWKNQRQPPGSNSDTMAPVLSLNIVYMKLFF
jgi:hypothetical protein